MKERGTKENRKNEQEERLKESILYSSFVQRSYYTQSVYKSKYTYKYTYKTMKKYTHIHTIPSETHPCLYRLYNAVASTSAITEIHPQIMPALPCAPLIPPSPEDR